FGAGILSFEGALYAKEISFIVHGGSVSVNAKTEVKEFYVVNTSAAFNDNFDSRDLSFTNSLVNFAGAVNGSSAAIINSSANIKGLANFAGDIFVQDSFMQILAQLNANAFSINNSTGLFSTANLGGNLDSLNSYLSFSDEVLTSSVNINNSTAVFAGALKSSGIFINNSLTDFEGVSAGSITMINSSANIKGLANFAGDIFAEKSFVQILAQLDANALSINNSTGLFSTLNLAGNLDSLNSYLSFTEDVLTSSINVNNSTAVFAGALKSSGIFINNSLTDFEGVSAGSITMINSNVNIGGIADFTGNISADNSHVKFLQQTKGQDASFNNAQIVFEKDLLLNELSILASSVNFKSGVSTVSVLNVSHGFMSLQNGIAASSFYVLGNFSLEGSFAIDVNFEDALTDWISVGGNFSVDKSTLVINRLDGDKYYFNPLEFLRADRLNYDAKRFFVDPAYQIILGADGKSLLISMANEYGAWNIFVNSFRTYQDSQNPLVLQADIDAAAEINASPQAFASPQGGGFSVDGAGFSLNAKNDKAQNLGFIFYESSFTFKQITFKNFLAQSSSGAVFYAQNSSITFIGNINFLNNTLSASNDTGGGAIFAQNTQLNFEGAADTNSKIEFSSNVSLNGAGGALFIDEAETYFANVNIRFTSNSAQGNGGAIYLNGLLTFSNSTIAFINNFAGAKLNDIYFAAAQSELVFSGDNVLTNGIKTSGAGSIKKIDEGTLDFEGSPAIILNAFDIEAGTVNFKSNISTISVLRVQNDALLSLVNGDTGGRLFTEELIFTDAYLAFDVNFSNGLADKIVVDQIFSSNANSHFLLNVLSQIGDEIAILIETNSEISNIQEIYTANEDYEVYGGGYFIFARSKDSSSLPPAVISATDWKEFVNEYKYAPKVNGDWIELSKNIIASQGDENIDRSAAQVSFNIDGKNKILDADNQKTGFVLDAAAIAFKDITFKNFAGAQGAVIRALNKSSVTFLGTINFVNNQSDIYLNDSALYFNDVIFVNGLRTQGTGEVIKFGGGAAVFRDGIFVKNKMQIKNNPGLVPRVSNFEGSTNIENVFNVQDGSVIFESAVSSVAVMHVGQGAVVSLKDNNPSGALYVGQLELGKNVHLWFDIDFENSLSDIIVSTSAIVFGEGIVLNINNVSKDLFATNSVEIIFSGSQIDYSKIVYDSSKYSLGFGKTNNILQITNYAPPALRFDDLTSNQENVLNNINENYHLVGMILNLQDQAKQKQALDSLSSAFYANIFTQELHNNAKDLFMQLRHNELHNIWINISFSALEFRRPNQMLGVFNESGIGLNVGANILSSKLFRAGIITQVWSKNFSQLDNTANLLSLGIGGYADASIKGLNIGMVMQAKRGQGKVKRSIELDRVYGPQGDIRLFGFNESLNLNYMFDIVKTKRDQISAGPFVNADFSQINTREIIEEGGGLANLNVASQNLMQSMFHYGLQLKRQTNFYKVFAQGFVGQNLSPTQKIKTKFANTANNDFWEIESDETNEMFYGAQLGVSVNAGKFMQFLVMGNYQENDNYKNYTAGVQAQYQFLVKMPQALPKNLDMPKLQFVENSARLTKESQIALANFARHFAREKYIFKTMKIVFRINKSNDKVSQSANKLNFERAQNVKKVLAQNKMSARKVVLATKVSSAKTKISVRIVR
ncbi:MAG: hypothetical protein LBC07_03335, partial [Elusimicrobiota bacterium]|nr:hypothetical protein [Elusimicrobiota bacterium]